MDYIVTHNGAVKRNELNQLQLYAEDSVYEVIRIINESALFLEDHFARLIVSSQIRHLVFEMKFSEFRQNITELTRLNQIKNGNVKFILSEIDNKIQWSFSFIPHSYPDINDYLQGVSTGLLFAEREDPNAKIIHNTIRERANRMILDQKLFEVLLVDRNGMITEGSRSNVFFVKGHIFYTAPASEVLIGITRQKVLECFVDLDFQVIEEAVSASEISMFDAVFLTGTSPKILPIRSIGEHGFNTQLIVVKELMSHYNNMITKYIERC